MPNAPAIRSVPLAEALAAATEWWALAGVDEAFADEPRNWLAENDQAEPASASPAAEVAPPAKPPARFGGDPALWPTELHAFDAWWCESEALSLGSGAPRVSPRGEAGAALMVLVPMPEAGDREMLLSGPQGALVANMLRAMGLADHDVRLAPVLPRHVPAPDWQSMDGLAELTRHHVALARPQRLLALGAPLAPLLAPDAADPRRLDAVALPGGSVPAMVARSPDALLNTPAFRKSLWQRWLAWTAPR